MCGGQTTALRLCTILGEDTVKMFLIVSSTLARRIAPTVFRRTRLWPSCTAASPPALAPLHQFARATGKNKIHNGIGRGHILLLTQQKARGTSCHASGRLLESSLPTTTFVDLGKVNWAELDNFARHRASHIRISPARYAISSASPSVHQVSGIALDHPSNHWLLHWGSR